MKIKIIRANLFNVYESIIFSLMVTNVMLPGSVFSVTMRIRILPNNADPTGSGSTTLFLMINMKSNFPHVHIYN